MHKEKILGKVRQFPYRTAQVRDRLFTVPRETVFELERQLAEKAGATLDNHTVYELVQDNQPPIYILFHDLSAIFGRTLVEERW